VSIWDRATGQREFLWHSPAVLQEGFVDVDRYGRFLIWIEERGIRLERIPSLLSGKTPAERITHVGFTAAGEATTGSSDGQVRLWDPVTEKEIRRYTLPIRRFVQFANQARWAVCGTLEGDLQLWDIAEGKAVLKIEGLPVIHAIAFSPEHGTLGLGLQDGSVSLWDIPARKEKSRIRMDGGSIYSLAWSPDGKTLAWGNAAGEVVFAEGSLGAERLVFAPRGKLVRKVEFLVDGKHLRMTDSRGKRWDYTGELGRDPLPAGAVDEDAIGIPDSRWLKSAFMRQPYSIRAYSPDGRYAIGTDGRGSAMIWRAPWDR
jgi:WD40 repeat protein